MMQRLITLPQPPQPVTYHPDKLHLLKHRAKLSYFLDQIQGTGDEPKPNIIILLADRQQKVMLHSEVGLPHSKFLRWKCEEILKKNPSAKVEIEDLVDYDENAVRRMVNFFYSGVLPCSLAEVPELLALCTKLQVTTMRVTIEKFILQKAAVPNCLLDCWNITCHWGSDISARTRDFVLSYVMENMEMAILDERFPELDQGAVEALLQSENLPVRSEADVLRIALMYFIRRNGQTNTQSLLNVVRYNCDTNTIIRMRQDVLSIDDDTLLHCFNQNCAYGMWQVNRLKFSDMWPATVPLQPRGHPTIECGWIVAQFSHLVVQLLVP